MAIVADVSQRLEAEGVRHLIGGSFASSAWGEMRTTNDADFAVMIEVDEIERLVRAFSEPYYISLDSVRDALSQRGPYRMTNAIHLEEAFQIDLFLVPADPYNLAEFARARKIEIFDGIFVPFSAPEDIVLQKLRWYEEGRRVSDRQWNDIVRVLEFQRPFLDYAYLERWAGELGVEALLEQALAERTVETEP